MNEISTKLYKCYNLIKLSQDYINNIQKYKKDYNKIEKINYWGLRPPYNLNNNKMSIKYF